MPAALLPVVRAHRALLLVSDGLVLIRSGLPGLEVRLPLAGQVRTGVAQHPLVLDLLAVLLQLTFTLVKVRNAPVGPGVTQVSTPLAGSRSDVAVVGVLLTLIRQLLAVVCLAVALVGVPVAPISAPVTGVGLPRTFTGGTGGGCRLCIIKGANRGPLPALPAAVEVAAYRIAHEALTNAVRHAGTCSRSVSTAVDGDRLVLVVADDGRGVPAGARSGVGFASMRERAEELGGTLTVTSGPGTRVQARLPLGVLA